MKKVLIPLPSIGYDPTEVAIPWSILTQNNIQIIFSTPNGKVPTPDLIMLNGKGLGIWKNILKTNNVAVDAHNKMSTSDSFNNPIAYSELNEGDFDALLLPGGHAKTIKEYLESKLLQKVTSEFFIKNKPVGAICHGVVLAARSINTTTGKSVLFNYRTTSLLKEQELLAYNMTRLWMGNYYLTYPEITVEDEVKAALSNKDHFLSGPKPIFRDSIKKTSRGFVVQDRNYVSARWPGDAHSFSLKFLELVNS